MSVQKWVFKFPISGMYDNESQVNSKIIFSFTEITSCIGTSHFLRLVFTLFSRDLIEIMRWVLCTFSHNFLEMKGRVWWDTIADSCTSILVVMKIHEFLRVYPSNQMWLSGTLVNLICDLDYIRKQMTIFLRLMRLKYHQNFLMRKHRLLRNHYDRANKFIIS